MVVWSKLITLVNSTHVFIVQECSLRTQYVTTGSIFVFPLYIHRFGWVTVCGNYCDRFETVRLSSAWFQSFPSLLNLSLYIALGQLEIPFCSGAVFRMRKFPLEQVQKELDAGKEIVTVDIVVAVKTKR